jgi:hypothetical protein
MHKPRRLSLLILSEINIIGHITLDRAQQLSRILEGRTDRASDVLTRMRLAGSVRRLETGEYVRA